jgi:hypothetical protein
MLRALLLYITFISLSFFLALAHSPSLIGFFFFGYIYRKFLFSSSFVSGYVALSLRLIYTYSFFLLVLLNSLLFSFFFFSHAFINI